MFIGDESDYRKRTEKEMKKFVDKKLEDLDIRRTLQNVDESDLIVLYDFKSLYPSAQIDRSSSLSGN